MRHPRANIVVWGFVQWNAGWLPLRRADDANWWCMLALWSTDQFQSIGRRDALHFILITTACFALHFGGLLILSAVPLYRDFDVYVWLLHGKGRQIPDHHWVPTPGRT